MHFPSLSVGASLIVAFASMAAADGTAYNNALAKACVKSHSTPEEVSNVFQDIECVLAAIGTSTEDTGRPIDIFLTRWFEKAGPGNGTPQSGNLPPASDEVLAHLAYDQVGADVTEQSWVDAYYGALADVRGPYPSDSTPVKQMFANVAEWTGECDGSISANGFRNYVRYSSFIPGAEGGCS